MDNDNSWFFYRWILEHFPKWARQTIIFALLIGLSFAGFEYWNRNYAPSICSKLTIIGKIKWNDRYLSKGVISLESSSLIESELTDGGFVLPNMTLPSNQIITLVVKINGQIHKIRNVDLSSFKEDEFCRMDIGTNLLMASSMPNDTDKAVVLKNTNDAPKQPQKCKLYLTKLICNSQEDITVDKVRIQANGKNITPEIRMKKGHIEILNNVISIDGIVQIAGFEYDTYRYAKANQYDRPDLLFQADISCQTSKSGIIKGDRYQLHYRID